MSALKRDSDDVVILEPVLGGQSSPLEVLSRYLERAGEPRRRGDVESLSGDQGDGGLLVDATRSTGTLLSFLQGRDSVPLESRRRIRLHVMAQGPATSVMRSAGLLRKIQPYLDPACLVLWRSDAAGRLSDDAETYPKLMGALSALDGAVLGTIDMGTTALEAEDDRIFPQLDRVIHSVERTREDEKATTPEIAVDLPSDAVERLALILGKRLSEQSEAAAEKARTSSPTELLSALAPAIDAATAQIQRTLTTTLTDLEKRLGETSEERLAARLQGLSETWATDVRNTVVGAATVFVERTNTAFGKRAEHFTGRLEEFAQAELERDKRFRSVAGDAAAQATRASLKDWVEPAVGAKGAWFAAGAAACAACLALGTLLGYVMARAGL